jgi:CheY-specific phosphatase CheX
MWDAFDFDEVAGLVEPSEAIELSDVVVNSVRHILEAYGVEVTEPMVPVGEPDPKQIVALIGFVGDALRGSLTLIAPVECIRRTYPPGMEKPSREYELLDWAGELANLVLGRIKVALSSRGVDIDSSTPRVLMAGQLAGVRSTQHTVLSTSFSVADAQLRIWFDAVAPEGEPLFRSAPCPDTSQPEGEVLLFD